MSFDLGIWDADRPPRFGESEARYEQLCRGEDPAEEDSRRLAAFVEECERRWPAEAADQDEEPRLTGRRTRSGFMAVIRRDAATELYGDLAEMSERHGLVLFDPQSGMVKIPSRLSFNAEPPPMNRRGFGRR